ncbi:hypothetical protein BYT27DRAFT_6340070 [Phlegmacium glaucopus]|nr:hypothetical protein BYT27DRAFT_6340070 [Phlegmacium glaucopus]
MEGHTNNVSFAVFHPNLPIIISGSEDGTVKIWNSGTYRIENTLSYSLERSWCVALRKDANEVAVGFDEGVVVIKLGRDEPTFSMDRPGTGMKGSGSWSMESLHGGTLLGARGAGFVMFWDWESGDIVRWIDVEAKNVFWSGTGSLVAITAEDSFYILRFDRDAYNPKLEEGAEITDEGVEEAFEVVADVSEGVKTAKWVGDCFIYTTSNRLCYFVSSESYTISPFDTPLYLLGYIPSHNRVYLIDKDLRIY